MPGGRLILMKRMAVLLVLALVMSVLPVAAEGRLNVVATNFPCYDFARQVVGDRGTVTLLIKPGVEVHSYEPTPADIIAIGEADLFAYIGGEGDAWADNILSGFDGGDAPATLRMMDAVSLLEEEGDDDHDAHDAPEYDEHIWTSPKNAMAMVRAMADALCAIDADNADAYRASSEAYIGEIAALDAAFEEVVENGARRELVFADRFPFLYFTRAYGLDYVAAFPSCTADTEPTPQILMTLIQRVVGDHIPVVYAIELSTQAVAKTVAEETGAGILTLHSMQTVTQDEFDAGETYVSIMTRNLEAVRKGLE